MPFGMGVLEVVAVLVAGSVAAVCSMAGLRLRRWATVVFGCVALAALVTPADLFSMVFFAFAFLLTYWAGTYHRSDSPPLPA